MLSGEKKCSEIRCGLHVTIVILYIQAIFSHPIRAMMALFWLCMGKKKRARNSMGVMLTNVKSRYVVWRELFEDFSDDVKDFALQEQGSWAFKPKFLIVVHSSDYVVLDQWYDHYSIISFAELKTIPGDSDYIIHLRCGDRLAPHALFEIAKVLQNKHYDLVTFDDDIIDRKERRQAPYFKPQWNALLQLSSNYIDLSCALKAELGSDTHHFMANSLSRNTAVNTFHIPKVLKHMTIHVDQSPFDRQKTHLPEWLNALNSTAENKNYVLNAEGWITEEQPPIDQPLVSIIIPTRDMLTVLKKCVDSIIEKTTYTAYEIIIVDNDSKDKETLAYLELIQEAHDVKIVSYPGPFNYSAINNHAVKQATGDYICLLNNDTEIISYDWLTDMMRYATHKDAGAVGAKLLYPDSRIQHAGVVIGQGFLAGHGHRFQRDKDVGYFNRAHQPQYVKAVTAACLVVSREKFLQVGGLDEKHLTVAFNDVDLCLKLDQAGYNNVYCPAARLFHFESKSRGKDLKGEKRQRYLKEVATMQKRWKTDTEIDPNYSPNLTIETEDFSIKVRK